MLSSIHRLRWAAIFLVAFSSLRLASTASAIIPVVDAAANANILQQTVMQITQFAKEIDNQTEQIRQFYTEIEQLRTMIDQGAELIRIAGDPAQLLTLIGAREIVGSLNGVTELLHSQTVQEIFGAANGLQSLANSGLQMYSSGVAFQETLVNGAKRSAALYKNFATLEGIFNQSMDLRAKDRIVQQQLTTKISDLTRQLHSAKDNATRDTLMAGIHAAQAAMQASTAEVAKAQADYLANERQRRVQDEKSAVARKEEWDSITTTSAHEYSQANAAWLDSTRANAKQRAQEIQQKSPGMTANGYEIIQLPTSTDGN